jgi:hypothetical protein
MSRIRTALVIASSCGALSAAAASCSSSSSAGPVSVENDATAGDSAPATGLDAPASAADAASDADAPSDAGELTVLAADGEAGSQTPPMGGAVLEAWLATGAYKTWTRESAIHYQRSPSPHGYDRIYSNDVITANAAGTGAWPAGAAAVKELYTATTDTNPVGYAVYLKTQADSAGGANWYWYERVPLSSSVPHDDGGVVADGLGTPDSGTPFTICVNCHGAAGSDVPHTPSPGGRDEVYTPLSR